MRPGVAVRVRCGLETCEEYASIQPFVASWVEAAANTARLSTCTWQDVIVGCNEQATVLV